MSGLSFPGGSAAVMPLHLHPSYGVRSIVETSAMATGSHTMMLLSPHSEMYIRSPSPCSPSVES